MNLGVTKQSIGVWIRCPSSICGNHQWLYRGHSFIYATCPSCKRSVLISDNKIERPLRSVQPTKHKQIEVVSVVGATTELMNP